MISGPTVNPFRRRGMGRIRALLYLLVAPEEKNIPEKHSIFQRACADIEQAG